jgi:phosphatidylglycerophosphatase A
VSRIVATVGGIGLLPGPVGTWASLAAIPLAWLLHWLGGFPFLLVATALAGAAGFWAIRVEALGPQAPDPGHVVIDEVVGQWIALMPLSLGLWAAGAPPALFPWPGWVFGFLAFRLFDVWKPWPVSWADRRPGPAGVMLGDVFAGLMAALVVVVLAAIAHGWLMRGGAAS